MDYPYQRGFAAVGLYRPKIASTLRPSVNLAATVNVVLYDRVAKAMRSARKEVAA